MSHMGDEMILALAASLEQGFNKTAAKEEDKEDKEDKDCKKCKCDPCECDKDCKKCKCDPCECDKKDKKDDKKDKKKESAAYMVNTLYKLANELDEMGADEASSLVDDALRVIVQNIQDDASKE